MNRTDAQQAAIQSDGDTLVMAGAGTGKTRTLVERCLDRLLRRDPPLALDQMMLVTFTEAAAAEMRQRIRDALEDQLGSALDRGADPDLIQSHLAALDTAPIGTLHSFCLRLIRQHFHELGIDPQVSVLAEEQSALIAREVLEALFEARYEQRSPEADRFNRFLSEYARGWEERLTRWLLELHAFTQTRPDPEGWYRRQRQIHDDPRPDAWRERLFEAAEAWRQAWLPVWERAPEENPWRDRMVTALTDAGHPPVEAAPPPDPASANDPRYAWLDGLMRRIREIDTDRSEKGAVGRYRKPLEDFYRDAGFLAAFCPEPEGPEPIAEDWSWVREHVVTLIDLATEFAQAYAREKRERGVVDFHDLEQFALRLLWDPERREPTPLAGDWRARLELVFVDEYQDINEAQDTLLRALSRDGTGANRFLVGDVKQSIYRFRQAEPRIFQGYADRWNNPAGTGRTIFLSENFRSREGLLAFFNPLFEALMRRSVGGVDYGPEAALHFGNREGRAELALAEDQPPVVELHLRVNQKPDPAAEQDQDDDDPDDQAEQESPSAPGHLSAAEAEARMVARRLRELRDSGHPIWDGERKSMRPVTWSDMVILLRAPSTRVESFAKEFAAAGIPLHAKRTGFFDSIEVRDLINVLKLLDNPLQDLPTVAVLRSPARWVLLPWGVPICRT